MGKNRGGTQGFGRVSEHTRPSPYSPLQFRGNFPGAQTEAPAVPERPGPASRGRRVVVAAVIVMVVAGVGLVALFRPTPFSVPAASTAPAPTLDPAPGDAKQQRLAPSPVAKRS